MIFAPRIQRPVIIIRLNIKRDTKFLRIVAETRVNTLQSILQHARISKQFLCPSQKQEFRGGGGACRYFRRQETWHFECLNLAIRFEIGITYCGAYVPMFSPFYLVTTVISVASIMEIRWKDRRNVLFRVMQPTLNQNVR